MNETIIYQDSLKEKWLDVFIGGQFEVGARVNYVILRYMPNSFILCQLIANLNGHQIIKTNFYEDENITWTLKDVEN